MLASVLLNALFRDEIKKFKKILIVDTGVDRNNNENYLACLEGYGFEIRGQKLKTLQNRSSPTLLPPPLSGNIALSVR